MQACASQQLADFLQQLQTQKRASSHTLDAYKRDLLRLLQFCRDNKLSGWGQVSTSDIRAYISSRHRRGIAAISLQRNLCAIRSFYSHLAKHGQVTHNPASNVRAPKRPRKLPKLLDVDQLSAVLDVSSDDMLEIRDLAMFELFYSSGLRLSELLALDHSDLDLQARTLLVSAGKGGKSRQLPVGTKAIAAVKKWYAVQVQKTGQNAMFTSSKGARIGARNTQRRLAKWCQKRGIPEHVHPHMLRHSFASHLLEQSQDIRAVQTLLGHSSISSTQIYTHLDFQHLAAVYDTAHPRAKK